MSLEKKIYGAFEKGERRIEEVGSFPTSWFQFFNFRKDPFRISPIDPLQNREDLEFFINREERLEEIAELVGMTTKASNSYNLAIVGADGIGKTSIARVINAFAQEKGYNGMVYSCENTEVIHPEDYEKPLTMLPPDEDWQYIVFEDTKPLDRAKGCIQAFQDKRNLIISLWTPEGLMNLERRGEIHFDRKLFIHPLKVDEIKEIITKRIESVGGKKRSIPEDVLEQLAKNSLGVPSLSLRLAKESFRQASSKRNHSVGITDVKEASSRLGIDTEKIRLTTKEKEIVGVLLEHEHPSLSPPQLAEETSMDRVIAWKYLERLRKKGILEKEYFGKTSWFSLKGAISVRLQLNLYPKDV